MAAQQKSIGKVVWYVALWLFSVYLYLRILGFYQGDITDPLLGVLYFVQFGVHEMSHIVFGFLPAVAVAAAGSLGEVAFTSLVVTAAYKAKSYWIVVFGLLWLMLAFISMGNYMADARTQLLPLVGPGPDPIHDWHFVFGQLGWLEADAVIGAAAKGIGWVVGGIGLLLGLWRIITAASPNASAFATIKRDPK